jgi:hypothetical protein
MGLPMWQAELLALLHNRLNSPCSCFDLLLCEAISPCDIECTGLMSRKSVGQVKKMVNT